MQFTKVHQKLAKPVYEAIPKIAGKAEKECPECKGSGLVRTKHYPTGSFKTEATINCLACNGTGKIGKKWEWEPRRGEFAQIGFVSSVLVVRDGLVENKFVETSDMGLVEIDRLTPLLHWEKLVGMLKSMGYTVKLRDEDDFGEDCRYNCGIYIDKLGVGRSAKDFQEAVQKAILALLEQLEEKE